MRLQVDEADFIDEGSFGKIYAARVISSRTTVPQDIVVKKGRSATDYKFAKNPMLLHEACAMLELRGHPNIPAVYSWGRSQMFEYLVMERLGKDIREPLRSTSTGLTMRNLVALTCQMIDAVEHVHAHHIIHCDIKPGNFLFDLQLASGYIKLIDFGIARIYRDRNTLRHVPESTITEHIGTRRYTSVNVHLHRNPSRRDDMVSLAYSIINLLCNWLPWSRMEDADEVFALKQMWTGADLCAGYPAVFGDFLDYTRSLGYQDTPDYAGWRSRFLSVAPELDGKPLYKAGDYGPKVGRRASDSSPSGVAVDPKPESHRPERMRSVTPPNLSQFGICVPYSTWMGAVSVADEHLIGDERAMVRQLEPLEDPPMHDYEGEVMVD
ncbi:kinase-like protein [Schizophyllum commune H4-8]|nr:kinase-like protein [Schizophyllum commune H4-8]KAI5899216.1 kinase-like protein [Schizophyllum commune H4-8]